jgi:hypothetical protein
MYDRNRDAILAKARLARAAKRVEVALEKLANPQPTPARDPGEKRGRPRKEPRAAQAQYT